MSGLFIAAYILFGVMCILGILYLVSLFIYSKYVLFTKAKFSWPTLAIFGLMFVILLIAGVLFLTTLPKQLINENCNLHAGLCFGFLGLDILGTVAYILIVVLTNKKKIPYNQIPLTDFKPFLIDIKKKIGDINKFKAKLQKHHKKYYNAMLADYSEILKQIQDPNLTASQKYTNIVMFNDTFAHKWSTSVNKYHLLLVYEYLTLI